MQTMWCHGAELISVSLILSWQWANLVLWTVDHTSPVIVAPTFTLVPNYTAWWQRHNSVNDLPRVTEQPQSDWQSNLQPPDHKSDALSVVPPWHTTLSYDQLWDALLIGQNTVTWYSPLPNAEPCRRFNILSTVQQSKILNRHMTAILNRDINAH